MKAVILNVLESKLSRRKQKVRAGEPTNTGFLADSLMSSGVELKRGCNLPFSKISDRAFSSPSPTHA